MLILKEMWFPNFFLRIFCCCNWSIWLLTYVYPRNKTFTKLKKCYNIRQHADITTYRLNRPRVQLSENVFNFFLWSFARYLSDPEEKRQLEEIYGAGYIEYFVTRYFETIQWSQLTFILRFTTGSELGRRTISRY